MSRGVPEGSTSQKHPCGEAYDAPYHVTSGPKPLSPKGSAEHWGTFARAADGTQHARATGLWETTTEQIQKRKVEKVFDLMTLPGVEKGLRPFYLTLYSVEGVQTSRAFRVTKLPAYRLRTRVEENRV